LLGKFWRPAFMERGTNANEDIEVQQVIRFSAALPTTEY